MNNAMELAASFSVLCSQAELLRVNIFLQVCSYAETSLQKSSHVCVSAYLTGAAHCDSSCRAVF